MALTLTFLNAHRKNGSLAMWMCEYSTAWRPSLAISLSSTTLFTSSCSISVYTTTTQCQSSWTFWNCWVCAPSQARLHSRFFRWPSFVEEPGGHISWGEYDYSKWEIVRAQPERVPSEDPLTALLDYQGTMANTKPNWVRDLYVLSLFPRRNWPRPL